MFIFVVGYDASDNEPVAYKLWECRGSETCSGCPGRFVCYTKERVVVDGKIGIVIGQDERSSFGVCLEIANAMFTYHENLTLQHLSEEEREFLSV
jgi:hypothetical protein